MSKWTDKIEITPITPEMLAETYRRFIEHKIEPHRVWFRGGLFETSDPKLEFMIDNNIKTIDELLEKYPKE